MTDLFDLSSILSLISLAAIAILAVFVWRLHKAGVPNAQLAGQTALKVVDGADHLRDSVLAALHDWTAKQQASATLRASYFDAPDFYGDVGRLPASYPQAVRLDGAIVRNGDGPGLDYFLAPNGNVTSKAPA